MGGHNDMNADSIFIIWGRLGTPKSEFQVRSLENHQIWPVQQN